MSMEPTEKELDEMVASEIEHQQIEERKTPIEKIMDLLQRQRFLLDQARETCRLAEAEIAEAKKIVDTSNDKA